VLLAVALLAPIVVRRLHGDGALLADRAQSHLRRCPALRLVAHGRTLRDLAGTWPPSPQTVSVALAGEAVA
jgi:hypothetical protein